MELKDLSIQQLTNTINLLEVQFSLANYHSEKLKDWYGNTYSGLMKECVNELNRKIKRKIK